jgi:hypothetical protein
MKRKDKKFKGNTIKELDIFIEKFFDDNCNSKDKVKKPPKILNDYVKLENFIRNTLSLCNTKNTVKKTTILNLFDDYKKVLIQFKKKPSKNIEDFINLIDNKIIHNDKTGIKEKINTLFKSYSKSFLDIFCFDIAEIDINKIDYFLLYNSILQNINYSLDKTYPKDIFSENVLKNKSFAIDTDKIKNLKDNLFNLSNQSYIEVNKILIDMIIFIQNDIEKYSKDINIIKNIYNNQKNSEKKNIFKSSINKIEPIIFYDLFINYIQKY